MLSMETTERLSTMYLQSDPTTRHRAHASLDRPIRICIPLTWARAPSLTGGGDRERGDHRHTPKIRSEALCRRQFWPHTARGGHFATHTAPPSLPSPLLPLPPDTRIDTRTHTHPMPTSTSPQPLCPLFRPGVTHLVPERTKSAASSSPPAHSTWYARLEARQHVNTCAHPPAPAPTPRASHLRCLASLYFFTILRATHQVRPRQDEEGTIKASRKFIGIISSMQVELDREGDEVGWDGVGGGWSGAR